MKTLLCTHLVDYTVTILLYQCHSAITLTLSKLKSTLSVEQKLKQNPMQRRLANMSQLNILAVDDMPLNLKLLSTWLKDTPAKLMLASRGQEAIDFCQKQDFDLILMDIQMPVMDGIEATRLIRQTKLNIGTPIVALTAHAFNEERDKFLQSGFDDFIAKPIDLNHLLDIIDLWCTQKPVDAAENTYKTQEVSVNHDSTIDWDLALKRANYNAQSAQYLLTEFNKLLPGIIEEINEHFTLSRSKEVHATVHKLHGACCYTGVPKLQSLCATIENCYRNKLTEKVGALLDQLNEESKKVDAAIREKLTELSRD
jgi:two-component system sensor histidine kinase BarA